MNTNLCPRLTESLEQQVYGKNGETDKDGGADHANDAAGYFITKKWPVIKRTIGPVGAAGI
ncbi:hypothetical protein [Dyadobacter sp. 32]|uniref:hypothetical protein n=1 Tax=Dyadobacter sp. 32 TaxID=538966 RepID=UPI0011EC17BE